MLCSSEPNNQSNLISFLLTPSIIPLVFKPLFTGTKPTSKAPTLLT